MNSQTNSLSFNVIPVIDLLQGQVVRARHGERHAYRPIVSSLCSDADPLGVAQALFALYPFTTLYLADLDAIQRNGMDHLETAAALCSRFPQAEIWVDAGLNTYAACRPWLDLGARCVIGSESQSDFVTALQLIDQLGRSHAVLSLDFAAAPRGPTALFETAEQWPERVIAMTLARVGSYGGPDFRQLEEIKSRSADARLYAAGGIRDAADLGCLRAKGMAGALVASALHDRRLDRSQLAALMQ